MALRYIGSVVRPYESHGRLFIGDLPSYAGEVPPGTTVHIGYSSAFARSFRVMSCARAARGLILQLESVTTPEAVQELKNMGVFVDESVVRSLGRVQYFDDEIIGCTMVNAETGEELGTITEVWSMPASDIWVMDYRGREVPVPVVEEYIRTVDIGNRRVEIFVMPGLLELAESGDNDERDDE